jgi:hypothetical protein
MKCKENQILKHDNIQNNKPFRSPVNLMQKSKKIKSLDPLKFINNEKVAKQGSSDYYVQKESHTRAQN